MKTDKQLRFLNKTAHDLGFHISLVGTPPPYSAKWGLLTAIWKRLLRKKGAK